MPGDKSQIMNPLWLCPRKLKTNNSQPNTHTHIYINLYICNNICVYIYNVIIYIYICNSIIIYTYYIIYTCYIICILFVFTIFPGVNLNKELTPPAEVFGSHLLHPSPAAASFSKEKLCQAAAKHSRTFSNESWDIPTKQQYERQTHHTFCFFFSVYLYTTNHKRSQSPSVLVQDPFLYHKHSPSVVTLPREHPSHGAKEEIPPAVSNRPCHVHSSKTMK